MIVILFCFFSLCGVFILSPLQYSAMCRVGMCSGDLEKCGLTLQVVFLFSLQSSPQLSSISF